MEAATTGNGSAVAGEGALQLATFRLERELLGLEILQVQEIQRPQAVTPVPRAPDWVLGLIPLRGQVVPLVDLRRRLGIAKNGTGAAEHIVVRAAGTLFAFEVDAVGDVVTAPADRILPPPRSAEGVRAHFLDGVYPLGGEILAILNLDHVMDVQ